MEHKLGDVQAKLAKVFAKTLSIPSKEVVPALTYHKHPKWDSLTHLELISNIEQEFSVSISMDDFSRMDTFAKTLGILEGYLS
jgi:acyl carrier protein